MVSENERTVKTEQADKSADDRPSPHGQPATRAAGEPGEKAQAQAAQTAAKFKPTERLRGAAKNLWHVTRRGAGSIFALVNLASLTLFATLVIAAATVVYTIYAQRQWQAMTDSNRINKQSADAATGAARTAQDSLVAGERPWVGPTGRIRVTASSIGKKGLSAAIVVEIQNYGKAPAFRVLTDTNIVVSDLDRRVVMTCEELAPMVGRKTEMRIATSDPNISARRWGQVLFPGAPVTDGTELADTTTQVVGRVAYVIGCVVYEDQFANQHWTRFCYETPHVVRDRASFRTLVRCNTNNYTDDGRDHAAPPAPSPGN